MSNRLIGYQSGQGFLYDLSGASKMLFFILVSVACMATYDPRFILAVGLLSIYLFYLAKIRWRDISFVVKIIGSIALFNLLNDPFIVDQRDNNHCSEPKDHPHDLFCHKIRFSASDHHDTDDRNCKDVYKRQLLSCAAYARAILLFSRL